ncbi:hypothetical protein Taro_022288, partial [Colocasia esculenta]|nr:hypothetical protein [Colocasia esculenta]
LGIGLKKHKGSKIGEENTSCCQTDFWKALGECVDLPMGCVDTLSQTSKKGSLGRVSSVDTTLGCVDTLYRTGK